jgi:chemotaxis protein MotB
VWPGPVLLIGVSLSACVSQGTHDELKRKYDDAQATITQRDGEIDTLQTALLAEQTRAKQLDAAVQETQTRIAGLEQQDADKQREIDRLLAEGERLQGELATLLKDRSRLRESTAELKEALAELARRKAEADRRVAEFRNLLAKFKKLIDAGKLQVKIIDGRMVLALPTDVLFDSGSAKLSKAGLEAVTEVAAVLKTIKQRRFQVEGHTDTVPIRTARFPSNWELSQARALGVVKAMVAGGMNPLSLSAAGYGEYHPVATNDTEIGKAQNRRIEIVLVPDLSMLPGFDELNRAVSGSS